MFTSDFSQFENDCYVGGHGTLAMDQVQKYLSARFHVEHMAEQRSNNAGGRSDNL